MALKVQQTIEEFGLYRKLSGFQTLDDYGIVIQAQTIVSEREFRYIIIDMTEVTGIDPESRALFARMHEAASQYMRGMHVLFVGTSDHVKAAVGGYTSAVSASDWTVMLFDTVEDARRYLTDHVLSPSGS